MRTGFVGKTIVVVLALYPLWMDPAPAQDVSYSCLGEEIGLILEPTAVAIESVGKLILPAKDILSGVSHEILYSDERTGRLVFRADSADAVEGFKSVKSGAFRFYPVYRGMTDPTPVWAFDEVIVRIKSAADEGLLRDLCNRQGLRVLSRSPFSKTRFVVAPSEESEMSTFEWARVLSKQSFVKWAVPSLYGGVQLQFTPNDTYFPNQTHLGIIDAESAWDETTGASEIVVAILDEVVQITHPDLSANIWINTVESAGTPGIDDDGNGYTDDINGWNFSNGNGVLVPVTSPVGAHGTAVAGLISAVMNNGLGVAGVAPSGRVLSCGVWKDGTFAGDASAADAIEYAARIAHVINMSWGGTDPQPAVLDAIDYAVTEGREGLGCVVVGSAGNSLVGDSVIYPARYAWCVAVAESDETDLKHDQSSFGKEVTLIAPTGNWTTDNTGAGNGLDTLSEDVSPDPDYTSAFGGTSSTAPQAAAVAALVLSRFPTRSAAEVVLHLINSLDNPLPGIVPNGLYGKSPTMGYGRLNAYWATLLGSNSIDDRLEPNDSPSDAAPVSSGHYPWLYLGGNADYYEVDAVAGAPVICSVQYLADFGSLTLNLMDEDWNVVSVSAPDYSGGRVLETSLIIDYTPVSNGKLYIEVQSVAGLSMPYVMEVQVGRQDDSFEPNQSISMAARLTPGSARSYGDLVCNGGSDYYKVSIEENHYLYGLLSFNHDAGDLAVQLLHPNQSLLTSSDETTYGEQFDPYLVSSGQSGDYSIRVYSTVGDVNREYALHLGTSDIGPITSSGSDDTLEENDTIATAASISEGFYPNLALDIPADDTDIYKFTAPAGKSARITVGWSVPGVDIDIWVYDDVSDPPNAVPIAKSARKSTVRVESVTLPALNVDTPIWAVVYRPNVGTAVHTAYRMALEFLDPPSSDWVGFWRLNEGDLGTTCNPAAIRDWRGSLLSHAPSGYSGLQWVAGPSGLPFPGSEGVALNCSSGGFYYPYNGQFGELAIEEKAFTIWARIFPLENGNTRTIAAFPGVWEFTIGADDRLRATIRSGVSNEVHVGPTITSGVWQDVAFVWDPLLGQVRLMGTAEEGLVETVSPIGLTYSGTGTFHIGSSSSGTFPLGSVDQLRYYGRSMSLDELGEFSTYFASTGSGNWFLYE